MHTRRQLAAAAQCRATCQLSQVMSTIAQRGRVRTTELHCYILLCLLCQPEVESYCVSSTQACAALGDAGCGPRCGAEAAADGGRMANLR
jgi:hypothetical protein